MHSTAISLTKNDSTSTSTSTSPSPKSDILIREVVRAEGDLYLAAERLHTTKEDLLQKIAEDSDGASKLAAQLRVLNMVQVFDLINTTKSALEPVLYELEPKELARTYTSLITAFSSLSDKQTLQLLQSVTANVGINLVPWIEGPPQPTIIDAEES